MKRPDRALSSASYALRSAKRARRLFTRACGSTQSARFKGSRRGGAELETIAYREESFPRRESPPAPVRLSVFRRDRFHCLYCQRKVIFTPVMHLIGRLYPESFPYTPYWRGGQTHPAVILCSARVDHERPGAWGGSWSDIDNLVTACNPCNKAKADLALEEIGWTRHPPPDVSDWDGLTRYYAPLWNLVQPRLPQIAASLGWTDVGQAMELRYHKRWLRLLAT